jgi:hypothetical protein
MLFDSIPRLSKQIRGTFVRQVQHVAYGVNAKKATDHVKDRYGRRHTWERLEMRPYFC